MAPSTPPPPSRLELAAFTMASVSCFVMSPSTSSSVDAPISTRRITHLLRRDPQRRRGEKARPCSSAPPPSCLADPLLLQPGEVALQLRQIQPEVNELDLHPEGLGKQLGRVDV